MGGIILSDTVTLTINNWDKYNSRKDVKQTIWFRLENTLLDDPDFYHFSAEEIVTWIYILSLASKKFSPTVSIRYDRAKAINRLSRSVIDSTILKLQELRIVHVDDTCAYADDTLQTNKQTNIKAEKSAESINFNFEEIYKAYPKRDGDNGKAKAFAKLKNKITSEAEYQALLKAVTSYARYCAGKGWVGTTFVKQFLTFVNSDWNEWTSQTHSVNINPETLANLKALRNG